MLRARSSVRLEHRTFNPGVAGSTPVEPAINLEGAGFDLLFYDGDFWFQFAFDAEPFGFLNLQ